MDVPRAEALQDPRYEYSSGEDDTQRKRKPRKSIYMVGSEKISYPNSVTLFKTATNLSRVIVPFNFSELYKNYKMNYGFQVFTPIDGLNITRTGGIVFVKNAEKLANVIPAIYE